MTPKTSPLTAHSLRALSMKVGPMPYAHSSTKAQVLAWLAEHHPKALHQAEQEHAARGLW